jgi:hypothetical protein
MKPSASRLFAGTLLAILAWLALAGATAPKGQVMQTDKLIILSTSDAKGEVQPCG